MAHSFLTGDGKHITLWFSVVLHVLALGLNLAANVAFFVNGADAAFDLLIGWAACSLSMHLLAVIGTLVTTALIRDVFKQPIVNTVGLGLFLGALLATAKVSYTHGLSQPASSVENVNYVSAFGVRMGFKLRFTKLYFTHTVIDSCTVQNLSLFFQAFAIASLFANSMCSHDKGI